MNMMETAVFHVLDRDVFETVYEPSEDTFILIDALEDSLNVINKIRPKICIEVGSGSGVVISTIAKSLGNQTFYLCTDKNPKASVVTKVTSQSNGALVEAINMDLVECFLPRLKNSVDLLVFNPPYVVTPSEEINGDELQLATAGGKCGREVIDRFIPMASELLSESGLFFLVCIKENLIDDLLNYSKKYHLIGEVSLSRCCGREFLSVIRFHKLHK